ncbi:MAG: aldo/keto reductase [Nitrososphaeria archaeon]
MEYRKFGRVNFNPSALGFGVMRLPIVGRDPANIDEDEAIRMIRYAVDHGVNYIDTAYVYHSGRSEVLLGKALQDGYRDRVKIATKLPIWLAKSREDMNKILDEQLKRMQTDHVDFYLFHGLNKDRWSKILNLGALEWAEKMIADGKVGYLGFSFHDSYEVFKEIVDSYGGWAFCQIQYNYVDVDYQAGTRGLRYAASRGLAVVIMEPISGGLLAMNPPTEVQAIWNRSKIKRTPAVWALMWVWNHPEVSVVLSGMSTMQQVIENVESTCHSGSNILTNEELDIISMVRQKYLEYGLIGCKGCGYCLPCPQGVDIVSIFSFYNEYYRRSGDPLSQQDVIRKYEEAVPLDRSREKCIDCGECELKCPQQLPIRRLLMKSSGVLERNRRKD